MSTGTVRAFFRWEKLAGDRVFDVEFGRAESHLKFRFIPRPPGASFGAGSRRLTEFAQAGRLWPGSDINDLNQPRAVVHVRVSELAQPFERVPGSGQATRPVVLLHVPAEYRFTDGVKDEDGNVEWKTPGPDDVTRITYIANQLPGEKAPKLPSWEDPSNTIELSIADLYVMPEDLANLVPEEALAMPDDDHPPKQWRRHLRTRDRYIAGLVDLLRKPVTDGQKQDWITIARALAGNAFKGRNAEDIAEEVSAICRGVTDPNAGSSDAKAKKTKPGK